MNQKLINALDYQITYGAELEFYTGNSIPPLLLAGYEVRVEKGNGQYEVSFPHTESPSQLAGIIAKFKQDAITELKQNIIFDPKPYAEDYGSAMHIHLDVGKQAIDKAADALCHYLPRSFTVFASNAADYSRFNHEYMAPTHIAYGNNNRTCALRVPSSVPKRLEHRVAGSDSDSYLVLFAIIRSLLYVFIDGEIVPHQQKIYGNAFDSQYKLPPLPQSLKEALSLYDESFFHIDNI